MPENSNWDKLEFVIARKLHVQYEQVISIKSALYHTVRHNFTSSLILTPVCNLLLQKISIDFIKDKFEIYGSLEKIEIFHDNFNSTKFTHVTYKENRPAYFAILDIKHQKDNQITVIRPADAHLQPDNPVDALTSPFYNLPDDCLLSIFDHCDFHTLATLSTVCKRLSELLCTQVLAKIPKFTSVATNDNDVANGLLTVSRLVQCINPSNFHLKISRNLHSSVEWPEISVNMKSSMSAISMDMDFFKTEWLCQLEKIEKRIQSIHIHRSVYDTACEVTVALSFPVVTNLIISGYAGSCDIPDLSKIVCTLPKLEKISFRNGTITWDHVIKYYKIANKLQDVIFENCFFGSNIVKDQIIQIAGIVKSSGNHFPLCLLFDRIQTKNPHPRELEAPVPINGFCKCTYCRTCDTHITNNQCRCNVPPKCQYCYSFRAKPNVPTMTSNTESTYHEIVEVKIVFSTIICRKSKFLLF